jgi:hypothetical protein
MAFDKMQFYQVTFTLPDGEHIIAGFSSDNINVARQHYRRIVEQNPEARFDPAKVVPSTPDQVKAAVEAMRTADPSRPLATDLGLDSPNRVLTNPETVPGSNFIPNPQGFDAQS